jgi:hypothetical protein
VLHAQAQKLRTNHTFYHPCRIHTMKEHGQWTSSNLI